MFRIPRWCRSLLKSLSERAPSSTFAHELRHAVFDAPGWNFEEARAEAAHQVEPAAQRAYRTTTPTAISGSTLLSAKCRRRWNTSAELRANEFMGSLLVPRLRLNAAVSAKCSKHSITIHRGLSLDQDNPGSDSPFRAEGDLGFVDMECFEKAALLATRWASTAASSRSD